MKNTFWLDTIDASVTVCAQDGQILYMNEEAAVHYGKDGGKKLIGENLRDCHPGQSKEVVMEMLHTPAANLYVTEKAGQSTLVYQTPWFREGVHAGIVEILIPLPKDLRTVKR